MMPSMRYLAVLLLPGVLCESAQGAQLPVATQYALHCSGCHGLSGHGLASNGIPDLSEAWRYAGTEAGRRYLISVPGVAASRLNDDDAAAMLNWVIERFCSEDRAAGFTHFTAAEVGSARGNIASDAPRRRLQLLGAD
jgi:mono/diheme cytochrome c family protein